MKYRIILFTVVIGLLYSCDTANTLDDPSQNHFIKQYGGDGDQEGVDAVVGSDGYIYLLGNTSAPNSGVGKQLYLVKADARGILIWEKTFGGVFDEEAIDLELSIDGRLVVLANSKKGGLENDILLMTVSTDGIKLDSVLVGLKTISSPSEEADDIASSISITSDGFIVSGSTTSVKAKGTGSSILPEDEKDMLHLRFSNNLIPFSEANWTRTNGTNGTDGASKVYQVSPTLYYVFGYTNINHGTSGGTISNFDFWVFPLGATGVISGDQMYPGALTNDVLTSVVTPPVGSTDGFLLVGTAEDGTGNFDIYVNKLRKSLTFIETVDYQINKPLSVPLGKPDLGKAKVSAYPSLSSGYLLLANVKSTPTNSFLLTKISNDGMFEWTNPQSVIYGGTKDDFIGSVAELPDGKIILVGTMSLGDEAQKKMTLIKVNKDGKFLD